jgi:hypothetical protein
MELALSVFGVVFGVTILLVLAGILIDKSASHERNEGR